MTDMRTTFVNCRENHWNSWSLNSVGQSSDSSLTAGKHKQFIGEQCYQHMLCRSMRVHTLTYPPSPPHGPQQRRSTEYYFKKYIIHNHEDVVWMVESVACAGARVQRSICGVCCRCGALKKLGTIEQHGRAWCCWRARGHTGVRVQRL